MDNERGRGGEDGGQHRRDLPITLALVIAGVVAVGGLLVLVRRLKPPRLVCHFCGKRTVSYRELGPEEKQDILAYFHAREQREPDTASLSVCLTCRTVHDDFVDERAVRNPHVLGCSTYCKVCGILLRFPESHDTYIRCRRCGTPYEWQMYGELGFRFLMPPEGTRILPRARGRSLTG